MLVADMLILGLVPTPLSSALSAANPGQIQS
jgi:hypothetical protein